MRRLALGQYVRGASPLHRMDPRVKIVLLVAYFASVFAAPAPWGLALALTALAALLLASRVPLRAVWRASGPITFFFALAFASELAVVRTGEPLLAGIVTTDGLAAAVTVSLRLLAFMVAGALFALVTSPVQIADGTERLLSPLERLRVPVPEIAMTLSIAIRYVPILAQEFTHVRTAQAQRGAALDEGPLSRRARVLVSMVVPLFASALRHAEALAGAMEARCYEGGSGRTRYHVLRLRRVDACAIAIACAYLAAMVAIGVAA